MANKANISLIFYPTFLLPPSQGKLNTEDYLKGTGVNFTSIRPVYIYGPLNYNPVEEWFFHRIKARRPIPVPGSGMQVRGRHITRTRALLLIVEHLLSISVSLTTRDSALLQVTQLGHVKDLATAFVKTLGNRKAYNQIYNVAGASGWSTLAFSWS